MRFSTISTALLSLTGFAIAAPAVEKRAVTAQQLVNNINQLTQASKNLQPIVSNIQTGDSAIAKRQNNPFEPVITGFQNINNLIQNDIASQDNTAPYTPTDAQRVGAAWANFVTFHQELLKTLIGKSAIVEGIFLGPVTAILRSHEGLLDTFAFEILDVADGSPSATSIQEKKAQLDETLAKAICVYTPGGSLGLDLFC